jgi:hypothetical protein
MLKRLPRLAPQIASAMSIKLPSTLVATMKLSVPMNGVIVPFNRCLDNLSRFCRPILFHNDDPVFDLSCSGSSLLFRHSGRNFMLCTRHQLVNQGRDPKDVVLIVDEENGRKVALSPNEASRIILHVPEQANLEDIFLFEYQSFRDGRSLEPQFFQLNLDTAPDLRSVPRDKIALIFAIGYPTRFSSFETMIDEGEGAIGLDVVSRWCKLYLEMVEASPWDHDFRVPLQVHRRYHAEIGDPDGFSGSPVFFLYQDDTKQAHLGFAGMITDANKSGRFLIYEATYIKQVVAGFEM